MKTLLVFNIRKSFFLAFLIGVALSVTYLPVNVHAQNIKAILPKTPEKSPAASTQKENQTSGSLSADAENQVVEIVQQLDTIVVAKPDSQVSDKEISEAKGIVFVGMDEEKDNGEELKKILEKYLGQTLTFAKVDEIFSDIVKFYRSKDRPLVIAQLPEQEIVGNAIRINLIEGKMGNVKVTNPRTSKLEPEEGWFNKELFEDSIRIEKGEPIESKKLVEDLNWINQNPFRTVDAIYVAGQEPFTTDIELSVRDMFPFRPYIGMDDSGNVNTGKYRIFTGFNYGNVWGLDHRLDFQYTTDENFQDFAGYSAVYTIPLPWRHTFRLLGSYASSQSDRSALGLLTAYSWQVSPRYNIPLPSFVEKLRNNIEFGYDFKESNSNLEFGGVNILPQSPQTGQFMATYDAFLLDTLGSTSFDASGFWSPGGLAPESKDSKYFASRYRGDSQYVYARFILERVFRLPWDFSLVGRGTAQVSNANLLGSEQLAVGGFNSVRGYEEYEAAGDQGFVTNLELRTPSVSPLKEFGLIPVKDELQFLVFCDYGVAQNLHLTPGEDGNVVLMSVGPGFRYTINPYLTARFDYGFQLTDSGQPSASGSKKDGARQHFGITLSWVF